MSRYFLKETQSGKYTLIYKDTREIRLHSVYDPVKEAERAVSNFNKGRTSLILVLGLGLGFHLNSLNNKYPGTGLITVEHDREVADIALKTYPEYIKNTAVIYSSADLPKILEEIDMSEFKGISFYFHRPSYLINKDFYDNIINDINQYITSKISDLLTRFQFEEKWVMNIFSNIHNIFTSAKVKSLFGKFKGYPGIIISAGPSLRKNAELLKKINNRALIISVDTAYKVLQKKNVQPHIVMTLDAQTYSMKHFQGLNNYDSVLLADIVSCRGIIQNYKGNKLLSTTAKYYTNYEGEVIREATPAMDWIEKYIPPIGDIQSGGSVATSVFDLLLNLGCDPIILLGQDLAYTGREIHCSGTYHNDEWLPKYSRFLNLDTINQNVIRKRKIKYITAYGGKGKIISDFVFDLYRGWFEDSAGKVNVSVINASEGGSEIKNTSEQSLASIINSSPAPKVSPGEIINKVISSKNNINFDRLYKAIAGAIEEIKKINSLAQDQLAANKYETDIITYINDKDLTKLFNPFLRKTHMHLSRHEIAPEKASRILHQDIITSSDRLIPILKTCLDNLNSI